MKKRLHIYYNGRVQGVGFRFSAEYIAQELNLTGWIKNLPDGRVELIAEGDEGILKKLIDEIENRMGSYVSNQLVYWEEFKGEFEHFGVIF